MKLLLFIPSFVLAVGVLNADEAAAADNVKADPVKDDLIQPVHVNHDNCTMNSKVHDFGDLWLYANGEEKNGTNESVFVYTLESGELNMCDVDAFRIVIEQGINGTEASIAEKFAECANEIVEILKRVVPESGVSSEVMIKRLMHELIKAKAGAETDGGSNEIKKLVKLISNKIPLDQAKKLLLRALEYLNKE